MCGIILHAVTAFTRDLNETVGLMSGLCDQDKCTKR